MGTKYPIPFPDFSGLKTVREKRGRGESFQMLLSSILGVLLVGIRRAKDESSSTLRELRVGTKITGFLRIFK